MLFLNARLMPMSAPPLENAFVRAHRGKIIAFGPMEQAPALESGEQEVQLSGRLLMPGFIDAHAHIGIMEDSLGAEGDDVNEDTSPVTAHLRALDGVNPFDRSFSEARAAGVTCAAVSPGSANPVGGSICAIKTTGRKVDDMLVRAELGIKFALGENPKREYGGKDKAPRTRMGEVGFIREQLYKARDYMHDKERVLRDNMPTPRVDLACEALIPLLRGEIDAYFHAHRAYDILTGIRIAREFSLNYVLLHCTEGHLIADILAAESARAVCGPVLGSRSKPELSGLEAHNCAALSEAGVTVALSTDHPVVPIQHLPLTAALAHAGGLNRARALEAVTVTAARILGIEDRVGSIAPGRDADMLVFEGDPLAPGNRPRQVYIDGVPQQQIFQIL